MRLSQLRVLNKVDVFGSDLTWLYPISSHCRILLKLAKLALVLANTLLGSFPIHGKPAGVLDAVVRRL